MFRVDVTDEVTSFNTKRGPMQKQVAYAHLPHVSTYPVKISFLIRTAPLPKGSYQLTPEAFYVGDYYSLTCVVTDKTLRPITASTASSAKVA